MGRPFYSVRSAFTRQSCIGLLGSYRSETEKRRLTQKNRRIGDRENQRTAEKKACPLLRFSGSPVLSSSARFPVSSPEACFQKAIDIARSQSARSWELRALISLSRLWQQQGRKTKARQLLAEIHAWFTEGFATADRQEAKALLTALS
jgi:hypothetical protein